MKLLDRRLLGRRGLIPIAVMAATAVLAACSSSSSNGSSASGSSGGPAVVAGGDNGVINWAYVSDQPNWDPVVVGATSATQLLSTIYEPLFTLEPDGSVGPAPAESYKYNSAGNAVTITLKSGLKFQDGTPVNAQAVAFNVNRIKTQTNSALRALWQDVAAAKAAGLNVSDNSVYGWGVEFLNLNINQAPFNNPHVVAAVQYAINRQQLVSQLTFGLGTAAYQEVPAVSPLYNPALNSSVFPYDPAKARQELKEAGIAPGSLTIELYFIGSLSAPAELDDQFSSAGIINLSAPTISAGYTAARDKVRETPLTSPDYKSSLQAAELEAVEGGSNIFLYSTPTIFVTGKGWSSFPKIDGSFRWNGLTAGS